MAIRISPATIKIYFMPKQTAMALPARGPTIEPICWAENKSPKTLPFSWEVVFSANKALIEGYKPEKKSPTAN